MNRIGYVIVGAAVVGFVLVVAGERLDHTSTTVLPSTTYALDIAPRPGKCVRTAHLDYGNTAKGAATPRAALGGHADAGRLRARVLDDSLAIFEHVKGRRVLATYRVRTIPGTRGGWLLTGASYSSQCPEVSSRG